MKVAVIGSSTFPVVKAGPWLVDFIAKLPKDVVVYTRGSHGFDVFINEVVKVLEIPLEVRRGQGGADNYLRDIALVREVDEVHAFFSEETFAQGGTQHVIDKCLDEGKPAYSYCYDERDVVRLVGTPDDTRDGPDPDEMPPAPPEAVGQAASERAR